MAKGRLVGTDTAYTTGASFSYIEMSKFTCSGTGKVSEIHVYSKANGNVKVGIYADISGEPGSRLSVNNTGTAVIANQWNTISITELSVTSGTVYWLAIISDTTGAHVQSSTPNVPFGDAIYKSSIYADGLPSPAGTGYTDTTVEFSLAAYGVLTLSTSSISQLASCGSPKLNLILKPVGIVQVVVIGTPIVVTTSLIIYPSGKAQGISIGVPVLRYHQVISPLGIAQPEVVGQPWVGIFGFIRPQSAVQQISIGSPAILKYVWHVILDGQYATEAPGVNRTYVVGRDQYGNSVYGTAVDSAELDLVGERLDFQQELAIPTDSQAAIMASAVLSKMRLSKAAGIILIPPSCGQELWDLIEISDRISAQNIQKYRIIGIHLVYNSKSGEFYQRLRLAGL
jgi:hypothetical protein